MVRRFGLVLVILATLVLACDGAGSGDGTTAGADGGSETGSTRSALTDPRLPKPRLPRLPAPPDVEVDCTKPDWCLECGYQDAPMCCLFGRNCTIWR